MQKDFVAPSTLLNQWDIHELRYSFVWEDFECLFGAMKSSARPLNRVLSIGSSGDNAFALLLASPSATVVALDLSPAQTSLIREKQNALKNLSHPQFLEKFWGEQSSLGRLEKYFKKFREQALPLLWSREEIKTLTETTDLSEQVSIWNRVDVKLLGVLAKEFFSQTSLSQEGRDASQFAYVEKKDIGLIFLKSFVRLVHTQLISKNPYLFYFLTGNLLTTANAHPLWNPETYKQIQDRADLLEIHTEDLETYLSRTHKEFDFMNLSDIFEYISPQGTRTLFSALANSLSHGGRLTYWTLLVDRPCSLSELRRNEELSVALSAHDRTWFYSGFHVLEKTNT